MSNVIEQHILEMDFENKQFEHNVNQSINTLKKLKNTLNFDGVEKNFDALSSASNSIDFSQFNEKLSNVGDHITRVFKEIGIGALREFGASIERDVISKIKELTFGQFNEGWTKYNQKVESVQTIMAATGKTIGDVSSQLERLNWFSDETSYSFTDMTSNVAKFTGAGIELEDAVTAMQGISTWAALAGQNSNTAARAMYNLSQAMGMGYVGLADWKSIELANMATEEFKEVLLDTAAAMGTLQKYSDGTYQAIKEDGTAIDVTVANMRNTLNEKWLTKDVLMETLQAYGNFANDLSAICNNIGISAIDFMAALSIYDGTIESVSEVCQDTGIAAQELIPYLNELSGSEYELGRKAFVAAQEAKTLNDAIGATKDAVSTQWMNTFEYLFGNYEEAKKFFTEVTNTLWDLFATSGDIRNTILEQWSEVGGSIFRSGLLNVLQGISNIVGFIRDIITNTLGITGKAVNENGEIIEKTSVFAEKLLHVTEKFGEWSQKFADFTNNLSENLNIGDEFYVALGKTFSTFGEALGLVWNVVKVLSPLFKDLFNVLQKGFEFVLRYGVITLIDFVNVVIEFIKQHKIVEKVVGGIVNVLGSLFNIVEYGINIAHNFLSILLNIISESKIFKNIYNGISLLLDPLIEKAKTFFSIFSKKLKLPEFNYDFGKIFDFKKIQIFSDKIIPVFEKIKDSVSVFYNITKDIFSTISDKIKKFFNVLDQDVEFKSFISFNEILEKIKEKLSLIGSLFILLKENIKKLDLEKTLSNIYDKIKKLGNFIWETLSNIDYKSIGDRLVNVFHESVENIKKLFSNIDFGKIVGNIKTNLSKAFKNFNLSEVFDYLTRAVTLFGGFNLGKLFGSISNVISNNQSEGGVIGSIVSSLTDMFGGLTDNIKGFTSKTDDSKLMSIAKGIGIVTVALLLLASVDSDKIGDVLLGVGAAFGGSVLSARGMSIFDEKAITNIQKVGWGLIEIAGAIFIITKALEPLANMKFEQLGKMGGALTVILVEIMIFINNFANKNAEHDAGNAQKAAFALIEIAAAMRLMIGGLKSIASLNIGDYVQAMSSFVIIIGGIILAEKEAANIKHPERLSRVGAAALLLSLAIDLLIPGLKSIAKLNGTDYVQSLMAFTLIMVEMGTLFGVLSSATFNADNMIKISAAMMILAASMDILVPALTAFALLPWKSFGYFSALITSMLAFGAIASFIQPISVGLFAIGTALFQIGAGVALVGTGVALIGFGLVEIASALVMINIAGILRSISELGSGIAGLINQLDVTLMIKNLKIFFAALPEIISGFIIGMLKSAESVLSTANDFLVNLINLFAEFIPEIAKSLTNLIVESLASFADILPEIIGIIIKLLEGLDPYIPQIVEKLAAIFVKIFDSLRTHIPEMLTSFMNFISELFGQILSVVQGTNQDTLLKLAEMFGGLVAVIAVLDLIKSMIPGAMVGLLAISAFVAELGLIIAAFGALNQIPGFQMLVGSGGDLLEAIGVAIGKFVGGIIGGAAEGATSTLPKIGQNIADFWKNIQPFINGVTQIDMGTVSKVGILTASIIALTAADFLGGIADFMRNTLNIQEFGVSITNMWRNIQPFIEGVKGLSPDVVSAVETLSKAILILTASQLVDSMASFIVGSNDIDKFGASISKLGPYLKTFSDSVKDIDNRAVKVASEAIGILVEAFDRDVFKTGGLKQAILGENSDLAKFGKGLVVLGPSIMAYAESVRGLDTDVIENSIRGASALSEMAAKLPKKGGVIGQLKGNSDLVDFAAGLAALGPKLMFYANSVKGLDVNIVQNSINAATALTKLAEKLPDKSFTDRILNRDSMRDFCDSITLFGNTLKSYYDQVSNIKIEQISAVTSGIESIFKFVSNASSGTFKIDKKFKAFIEEVMEHGIGDFIKYGMMSMENFAKGIADMKDDVKNAVNAILLSITKLVTSDVLLSSFRTAGSDIMTQFAVGILSQILNVAAASLAVSTVAFNEFSKEEYLAAFKEAGVKVMQEFISGMTSQASLVQQAAAAIASSGRRSIESELQALHNDIQTWIDNSFNFNPVITPVFDESQLKDQLDNIYAEMDADRSRNYAESILSGMGNSGAGPSYANTNNNTSIYWPTINVNTPSISDPRQTASVLNKALGSLAKNRTYGKNQNLMIN